MPRTNFLDRLIAARFRTGEVTKILKEQTKIDQTKRKKRRQGPRYMTGVHNGTFYRIKLPALTKKPLPSIPKLHTPTSPPMRLGEKTKHHHSASELAALSPAELRQEFWERFLVWLKENYSTLILNFGSICTLIGFTRSDVLELRFCSVTGSVCAFFYHLTSPPIRWVPMVWSTTFAAVNGLKIFQILQERKGSVNLTEEQEERYIHFFMPHGVTPKQFELIHQKAEILEFKKGALLLKQHEELNHVYLVVAGTTRASILGRFLTAASTYPTAHEERVGGASGAWVGEMSLLERVWLKEQAQRLPRTKRAVTSAVKDAESSKKVDTTKSDESPDSAKTKSDDEKTPFQLPVQTEPPKRKARYAMYTIVAQEDCTVLRWSHDDMEALMERSTDMRAALTRAMTAAIVGKVINFTVSRSSAHTTWATWLDDWKYNAGAQIKVDERAAAAAKEEDEVDEEQSAAVAKENLPRYPIKHFR